MDLLGDAAIAELVSQTAAERGVMTPDEAIEAVMSSDLAPSVSGFKRDENGQLCIEGRIVKAALKEWANSAYPARSSPARRRSRGCGRADALPRGGGRGRGHPDQPGREGADDGRGASSTL